jgi:hypothetical protein
MQGQLSAGSIYSRIGLGMSDPGTNAALSGGSRILTVGDPSFVNFYQPASYAFLEQPTLQIDARAGQTSAITESGEVKTQFGMVNEFAFAIKKFGKPWAAVLGIRPVSNIGYSFIEQKEVNDSLSATYRYEGSGGLSDITLGFSRVFAIRGKREKADSTKRVVHQLSLGVNGDYLFGSVKRLSSVLFSNTEYLITSQDRRLFAQGFSGEAGALYRHNFRIRRDRDGMLTSSMTLILGGTFSIPSSMLAEYNSLSTSIVYSTGLRDTTDQIEEMRGRLQLPSRIGLGAALRIFHTTAGSFTMGGDYQFGKWSTMRLELPLDLNIDDNLLDATTLSAGIDYKPNSDASDGLLHRMNYRLGYRHHNSYMELSGQQISQQTLSAGLSAPLAKSTSRFHISAEFTETAFNTTLIPEKTIRFLFGFSLSPSVFDRWFRQIKYD